MNVPEKARPMIQVLRERILSGEFSDGHRLPPMRQLMNEFSISHGSIKKGIDYLAKIGLLETIHGSGIFVKQPATNHGGENPHHDLLHLAVFGPTNLSLHGNGIFASVFSGIHSASVHHGYSLMLNPLLGNESDSKRIINSSRNMDGVIFLKEMDSSDCKINLDIPAVGVCIHNPTINNLSIVDLDPYQSAFQAAEYFRQRNIKHVKIVSSTAPAYVHRGNVFAEIWKNYGGTLDKVFSTLLPAIDINSESGYLFTTGSFMQWALEEYMKTHNSLPDKDITLLGLDGKNFTHPRTTPYYKVPAIVLDWENVGKVAFEETVRRIKNPGQGPRRIYLSGYLRTH